MPPNDGQRKLATPDAERQAAVGIANLGGLQVAVFAEADPSDIGRRFRSDASQPGVVAEYSLAVGRQGRQQFGFGQSNSLAAAEAGLNGRRPRK